MSENPEKEAANPGPGEVDPGETLYSYTPEGGDALHARGFTLTETTKAERVAYQQRPVPPGRSKAGRSGKAGMMTAGAIIVAETIKITIKTTARSTAKTAVRGWTELNVNFDAFLGALSYGLAMTAVFLFSESAGNSTLVWVGWLLLLLALVLVKAKHLPRQGWIVDLLKREPGKAAEKIAGIREKIDNTFKR